MGIFTKKNMVISLISTIALTATLNAADYGSVNGEAITQNDLTQVLRNSNVAYENLPQETKQKVLDQVVEKKLLSQNALKSSAVSSNEYKVALDKLKQELALEVWMQSEFKKVNVSDKDAKDFYNNKDNKSKFEVPATMEANHILTKEESEAKAIIKELDKAKDKKAKFIELAKSKSVGPTGPKGGYLGKFNEKQMVPEFSKAAKALKVGEYSKVPVKTQFGFHVIYMQDKKDSTTLKFEQVQDKIKESLAKMKFQEIIKSKIDSLKAKAKIVIK